MKVDVQEDGSEEKKTGVSILNDFVDIQDNKEVENLKNLIEEYKSDISQKNQTITSLREEITQRGNSSENTQKIQYDFLGEYKAHRVKLMSQLKSHRDQSEKQTEINKILEKEKQIIEKENDILEKEKLLLEDKIKFYEEEITKVHKEQKKLFEAIEERNISKEKLKSLESINSKLEQQLKVYENEISSLRDENEILVETNRVQSDKLKKRERYYNQFIR